MYYQELLKNPDSKQKPTKPKDKYRDKLGPLINHRSFLPIKEGSKDEKDALTKKSLNYKVIANNEYGNIKKLKINNLLFKFREIFNLGIDLSIYKVGKYNEKLQSILEVTHCPYHVPSDYLVPFNLKNEMAYSSLPMLGERIGPSDKKLVDQFKNATLSLRNAIYKLASSHEGKFDTNKENLQSKYKDYQEAREVYYGAVNSFYKLDKIKESIINRLKGEGFQLGVGGSRYNVNRNDGVQFIENQQEVPKRVRNILDIINGEGPYQGFSGKQKVEAITQIINQAENYKNSKFVFFGKTHETTNDFIKGLSNV